MAAAEVRAAFLGSLVHRDHLERPQHGGLPNGVIYIVTGSSCCCAVTLDTIARRLQVALRALSSCGSSARSRSSSSSSRKPRRPSPCSSPTTTARSSRRPRWTGAAPDTRLNAQRKAYTAARSDARSTRELAVKAAADPVERASFDPFFTFFLGGVAVFDGERRIGAWASAACPARSNVALLAIAGRRSPLIASCVR